MTLDCGAWSNTSIMQVLRLRNVMQLAPFFLVVPGLRMNRTLVGFETRQCGMVVVKVKFVWFICSYIDIVIVPPRMGQVIVFITLRRHNIMTSETSKSMTRSKYTVPWVPAGRIATSANYVTRKGPIDQRNWALTLPERSYISLAGTSTRNSIFRLSNINTCCDCLSACQAKASLHL